MLDLLLNLETTVELSSGEILNIADRGDWKTMIKCSNALAVKDVDENIKKMSVLTMFYEEISIDNIERYAPFFVELMNSMFFFLSYGNMEVDEEEKPPTINYEKDIKLILEGIAVQHGEIRSEYLHWWTFLGYLQGIKDCTFNTVTGIRYKLANGKKLEKYEVEFYDRNENMIKI